ncbi:MAG: S41 family peptidase [Pseudomonadales bacterium]
MILRPLTLLGIVISMVTGIAMGIIGYRNWLGGDAANPESQAFEQVLRQVHDNYVSEVPTGDLLLGALRGMVQQLDDHSLFLDSGEFDALQEQTSGHFGGVGIELGLVDGYFTVITPLDGTPASDAGLQAGDRIVALNGSSLKGRKLIDVVHDLRGAPGSELGLRIVRGDGPARDVTLTRSLIEIASVQARLLEPGFGYARISQFQSATGEEFSAAIERLQRESGGALAGLVLDLRNNPGGVLQASVAVADALLKDGLIVYTEGRMASSNLKYRASGDDLLNGAPVVVLINGGSASAAEIVAGALKDHRRATLLGTRSYGKGSVQSVVPVSNHQAIKLTTAYYFTPSGTSINHRGIEPDIERPRGNEDPLSYDNQLLGEALDLLKQESGRSLHAQL